MSQSSDAERFVAGDRGWLLRKLLRRSEPRGNRIDDYEPAAIAASLRGVGRLFDEGSYFPLDIRGWANVPSTAALFVSNHSGGALPIDVIGLLAAWYRRFGLDRPLRPLAHELVLSNRITGQYMTARGVLRAHPELACQALKEGRDVLVMPGGDKDAFRPYVDRYRLQFGGRTGYARLALRAGVPIVPIAHAGAHETLLVLTDGGRLARALNLKKVARIETLPVALCVPWIVTFGLPPHFPLPAKFRYSFGAPIVLPRKNPKAEPTADEVVALDNRVRTSIQGMLDVFAQEERAQKEAALSVNGAPRY